MDLREILSAQLPPTRPDEPARLRQDILDELNDHLVCAYNREILRGVDRAVAERRVLEQFGDPAALARRLWLDEMKGKIMAQRVTIGTCLLVAVVSLALVGLLWQQSIHAQRMAAAQTDLARFREQEMLKQLRDMSEAIRHPRSPDSNPVRIKLSEETADGSPVAGAWIALTRLHELPATTAQRESDRGGVADFGLVSPGDYRFEITKKSAEAELSTSGELHVQPGSDVTASFRVPMVPPPKAGVRVRWKWPADLEKESIQLCATFAFHDRELEPNHRWALQYSLAQKVGPAGLEVSYVPLHAVLCGPSDSIAEFEAAKGPFLWTLQPGNLSTELDEAAKLGPGDWADVSERDLRELRPASTMDVEIGTYVLAELLVLRPSHTRNLEPGRRRFDVLAETRSPSFERAIRIAADPPETQVLEAFIPHLTPWMPINHLRPWNLRQRLSFPTIILPNEYWRASTSAFEARPAQPNEWTISIPDALAQAVRDALKAEKAPQAKPAKKIEAINANG